MDRRHGFPGVSINHNEAIYLSWIDCRQLGEEDPAAFFRREAGVVCNSGAEFGDGQCVRMNFACPRSQLAEALDRMERALAGKFGGSSRA